MEDTLGKEARPCLEVKQLLEIELISPKVVAKSTQIVFAEGWLIE
jgi:hypothetical protein